MIISIRYQITSIDTNIRIIILEPFAFAIIIPYVYQFPILLGYISLLVYPKSLVR